MISRGSAVWCLSRCYARHEAGAAAVAAVVAAARHAPITECAPGASHRQEDGEDEWWWLEYRISSVGALLRGAPSRRSFLVAHCSLRGSPHHACEQVGRGFLALGRCLRSRLLRCSAAASSRTAWSGSSSPSSCRWLAPGPHRQQRPHRAPAAGHGHRAPAAGHGVAGRPPALRGTHVATGNLSRLTAAGVYVAMSMSMSM